LEELKGNTKLKEKLKNDFQKIEKILNNLKNKIENKYRLLIVETFCQRNIAGQKFYKFFALLEKKVTLNYFE
jgi:hypothetical protein